MSNTYHQIYIQAVFAVRYRDAILAKAWRPTLHTIIGGIIKETGCKSMIVNGVEDHVHCLFELKPSVTLSTIMKNAKSKSSKWINENNLLKSHFEWQEGYGAFSYSPGDVDRVYNYIRNQEAHHQKQFFLDEYKDLLRQFKIDYDDRYIFKDLI